MQLKRFANAGRAILLIRISIVDSHTITNFLPGKIAATVAKDRINNNRVTPRESTRASRDCETTIPAREAQSRIFRGQAITA